ncbi:hypothetical protein [Brachyspira catarrhinii]|uniref:G domain-containing protein n=1 Tax=Brachyspira catarrhinii TaxID=2528966 RepID=A0ABY2TSF7_9SPIR|nr:hypothetical protein [Brachyspira catarrhinii]TKZ35825.1 hypothetical protein EZH24_03265 [Brachyspira catarrhinii]
MLNINSKEDLKNIYRDIKNDIDDILIDVSNANIEKEEDTIFIKELIKEMEKLNKQFDEDIDFLEKNSEWEKFTIAFFGETNAGKSTIIESLRIIFDELNRRREIENNMKEVKIMEDKLEEKSNELLSSLSKLNKIAEDEDMKSIDEIKKLQSYIKKGFIFSIILSIILSGGSVLLILKFVFGII